MAEEDNKSRPQNGLSEAQVIERQNQFGKNIYQAASKRGTLRIMVDIIKEPMFLLLVAACSLYFLLGEISEGLLMLLAMLLVTLISLYQEVKTSNALEALQEFAQPTVKVIRGGKKIEIATAELVVEDIMLLEEGMKIPADAQVLEENDFSVNESIITGESLPTDKHAVDGAAILYQGTTINSGKCVARVTAIGNETVLGKLGKTVSSYAPPKTLLQVQINKFVRRLAFFGLIGFVIIFLVNYLNHGNWTSSLLYALALAMSAIPEEIPVAFSSFMALGAYQMSKLGIISRKPQIVENLGTVNVICFDKTGTLTQNKMQVKMVYDYKTNQLLDNIEALPPLPLLYYAMLASEKQPFDAMEKAIYEAYLIQSPTNEALPMIHEYPLEGRPPMMTHVYPQKEQQLATAKGAVERILQVCLLSEAEKSKLLNQTKALAEKGFRVIGVASAIHTKADYPKQQADFDWRFEGLLALYDPPKKNIAAAMQQFYAAQIEVKILTGDYAETAITIANQIGIAIKGGTITGDKVMEMTAQELEQKVNSTTIFARMFPDAKLKVIEALKANGAIVAMTGDGVNDGPALKAAGVGIAMGKKGTAIAQQAADLILTDDNLERMVVAIREGRKIFTNLKKAIRYIISIHIPIILIAALPLLFGWKYINIFTPIHVIFLELIMGPTCSIFFEREPVEESIMQQTPRKKSDNLFTKSELLFSIFQGLAIAAGSLTLYQYCIHTGIDLFQTRAIVFTTLLLSNVLLTFSNRSFTNTIFHSNPHKNILVPYLILISILFLGALHFIPFVRNLFQIELITLSQWGNCVVGAILSVWWVEVYKFFRFKKAPQALPTLGSTNPL